MTDIFVYDTEDAISSKLYQSMRNLYPNFEKMAFKEKWIIAIPIQYSFEVEKITKQYIDAHIFKPSPFYLEQYISLTGKKAEIKSDYLLINKKSSSSENTVIERSCRILEDNEVYNEHVCSESYHILLIDKPVEGKYSAINTSQIGITALHKKSVDEIVSYLKNDPLSKRMLISLDSDIFYLLNSYKITKDIDYIHDLRSRINNMINTHYAFTLNTNQNWSSCKVSKQRQLILRCCLETYIMEKLYPLLFDLLRKKNTEYDHNLERYIYYLQQTGDISIDQLGLKPILYAPEVLQHAITIFNRLPTAKSVLSKLKILLLSMTAVNTDIEEYVSRYYNKTIDLTADDMVPLLILVISKSSVGSLLSTIDYIMDFDFTDLKDRELGFCFVTFQLAIQYLSVTANTWCKNTSSSKVEMNTPVKPIKNSVIRQEEQRIQKERRIRRGTIAFNPQEKTYRNEFTLEDTVVLEQEQEQEQEQKQDNIMMASTPSSSVYSQILVKSYLQDDLPKTSNYPNSTDSEETYWWNSKSTTKKKFTLPWNYTSKKKEEEEETKKVKSVKSSPRLFGRKSSPVTKPQTDLDLTKEFPPKKHYFCCCFLRDDDDDNNNNNDNDDIINTLTNTTTATSLPKSPSISTLYQPPSLVLGDNAFTPINESPYTTTPEGTLALTNPSALHSCSLPTTPLSGMLNNSTVMTKPDADWRVPSRTLPSIYSTLRNSAEGRPTCLTEDDEGSRDSSVSIDRSMGSFMLDLKRNQDPVVSSRLWGKKDQESSY